MSVRNCYPGVTSLTFDRDDIEICITIGKERYYNNKKNHVQEQRYSFSRRSGLDLDVFGVCGEYAFMKMAHVLKLNQDRLLNTTPQNYRTDRGDVQIGDQIIDVKCCLGHRHDLWVRKQNRYNPADIYVFITYERVNPLQLSITGTDTDAAGGYRDDFCSLHLDEEITFVFQGAVRGSEVFQPRYLARNSNKYVYPKSQLKSLLDCLVDDNSTTKKTKQQ